MNYEIEKITKKTIMPKHYQPKKNYIGWYLVKFGKTEKGCGWKAARAFELLMDAQKFSETDYVKNF